MTTLPEFIAARLDADEAAAIAAGGKEWHVMHDTCGPFCDKPCPEAGECHNKSITNVATGERYCTCAVVGGDDICVYDEGSHSQEQAEHIALHDPSRVLREVAAKRAILAEHCTYTDRYGPDPILTVTQRNCIGCGFDSAEEPHSPTLEDCPTLRALAAIWNDHPEYEQSWAPEQVTA